MIGFSSATVIGQIVMFQNDAGQTVPAIITKVHGAFDNFVDLETFGYTTEYRDRFQAMVPELQDNRSTANRARRWWKK